MKPLLAAVTALTAACATAAPEASAPVAPARTQTQTADAGYGIYPGTYALQAPNRVLTVRIWVDAEGVLNGEIVELGQPATFRPGDTEHKFVHSESDSAWFVFTVENGRATRLTMHQRGPRDQGTAHAAG